MSMCHGQTMICSCTHFHNPQYQQFFSHENFNSFSKMENLKLFLDIKIAQMHQYARYRFINVYLASIHRSKKKSIFTIGRVLIRIAFFIRNRVTD